MKDLQFEVLVVGAGPAGLAAAVGAAESGATIGLIDDNPQPGGQIWRGGPGAGHTDQAAHWIRRVAAASNLYLLTQARVVAAPDAGRLIADTASGAIELAYEHLILAPGARELFLPFPGWTLPGVFGAGGLQALVKGGMPIKDKRVVVAGSGPLLLAVASYLTGKGARVTAVIEQTPWRRLTAFSFHLLSDWDKLRQTGRLGGSLRGVPFRAGAWVVRVRGTDRLEAVTVQHGGSAWTLECDYLACGFGLIPNLELPHVLGCTVVEGAVAVDERQLTSRDHIYAAGEVTGVAGLEAALAEGRIAGLAATGQEAAARALFPSRVHAHRFAAALTRGFALRDELKMLADPDTLVCRCEDVPFAAMYEHASWRSAKLHTRCGMGPCQGRVCGGASAFLFGWTQDSVRAPITPCTLGSLAQIGASLKSGEKVVQ
jgi:NADPH-dependent 2,4-dienoyl-CoA reductase/sulfur reductase-like enzyme